MKTKRISSKWIALLCAFSLFFSSTGILSTIAKAEENDYTKIQQVIHSLSLIHISCRFVSYFHPFSYRCTFLRISMEAIPIIKQRKGENKRRTGKRFPENRKKLSAMPCKQNSTPADVHFGFISKEMTFYFKCHFLNAVFLFISRQMGLFHLL